eukprot:767660-Hanusia_phi.AAC.4
MQVKLEMFFVYDVSLSRYTASCTTAREINRLRAHVVIDFLGWLPVGRKFPTLETLLLYTLLCCFQLVDFEIIFLRSLLFFLLSCSTLPSLQLPSPPSDFYLTPLPSLLIALSASGQQHSCFTLTASTLHWEESSTFLLLVLSTSILCCLTVCDAPDSLVTPPELAGADHFPENLIFLPFTFQLNSLPRLHPQLAVQAQALPDDEAMARWRADLLSAVKFLDDQTRADRIFVLCAIHEYFKIDPHTFTLWSDILTSSPNSSVDRGVGAHLSGCQSCYHPDERLFLLRPAKFETDASTSWAGHVENRILTKIE